MRPLSIDLELDSESREENVLLRDVLEKVVSITESHDTVVCTAEETSVVVLSMPHRVVDPLDCAMDSLGVQELLSERCELIANAHVLWH